MQATTYPGNCYKNGMVTYKHGGMLAMQLLWNYQYPPLTQDKSSTSTASRRCYHCARHDHHRSLCPSKFKLPSAPSINAAEPALKSQQDTNVLVQNDKAVVLQNGSSSCSLQGSRSRQTGTSSNFIRYGFFAVGRNKSPPAKA